MKFLVRINNGTDKFVCIKYVTFRGTFPVKLNCQALHKKRTGTNYSEVSKSTDACLIRTLTSGAKVCKYNVH